VTNAVHAASFKTKSISNKHEIKQGDCGSHYKFTFLPAAVRPTFLSVDTESLSDTGILELKNILCGL